MPLGFALVFSKRDGLPDSCVFVFLFVIRLLVWPRTILHEASLNSFPHLRTAFALWRQHGGVANRCSFLPHASTLPVSSFVNWATSIALCALSSECCSC